MAQLSSLLLYIQFTLDEIVWLVEAHGAQQCR